MICPRCKYEYEKGFTVCPDCGIELENDEKQVVINGRKLTCIVCGGTSFTTRKSLLNSRALTFFNLDWANDEAVNYICDDCGYIFWFAKTHRQYVEKMIKEKYMDDENMEFDYEIDKAEEDECPNCFCKIGKNDDECAYCGYKLKKV